MPWLMQGLRVSQPLQPLQSARCAGQHTSLLHKAAVWPESASGPHLHQGIQLHAAALVQVPAGGSGQVQGRTCGRTWVTVLRKTRGAKNSQSGAHHLKRTHTGTTQPTCRKQCFTQQKCRLLVQPAPPTGSWRATRPSAAPACSSSRPPVRRCCTRPCTTVCVESNGQYEKGRRRQADPGQSGPCYKHLL